MFPGAGLRLAPGGALATDGRDRRSEPRISGLHPSVPGRVNYVAGEVEGGGMILDISRSGAAVEGASEPLELGAKVDLYFLQRETGRRMKAVAEVVRSTPTGFAVRFERIERELERLVLRAAQEAREAGDA